VFAMTRWGQRKVGDQCTLTYSRGGDVLKFSHTVKESNKEPIRTQTGGESRVYCSFEKKNQCLTMQKRGKNGIRKLREVPKKCVGGEKELFKKLGISRKKRDKSQKRHS